MKPDRNISQSETDIRESQDVALHHTIRQAALGIINGKLEDWPELNTALKRHGVELPDDASSDTCRLECLKIVSQHW
ncbi:MAG: hypothetical protein ACR2PT_08990 [Endozoicomonas sp.]